MTNPVVHFDIGSDDAVASARFYSELFGWRSSDNGANSKCLETGSSKGISGFTTALGPELRQYVMLYIEVQDIELITSKAEKLGAVLAVPAISMPDGRKFAWLKDPWGNLLGLIQLARTV